MRISLLVSILAFIVVGGRALTAGEDSLDAAQKERYQKVCESLVAPCCWSESVAMHRSGEALRARDEVAALIVAGRSDREILDVFVARYGARVLIEPEASRARWLYVFPILVLAAGVLAAIRVLRKWRRPRLATRV